MSRWGPLCRGVRAPPPQGRGCWLPRPSPLAPETTRCSACSLECWGTVLFVLNYPPSWYFCTAFTVYRSHCRVGFIKTNSDSVIFYRETMRLFKRHWTNPNNGFLHISGKSFRIQLKATVITLCTHMYLQDSGILAFLLPIHLCR